MENNDGNNINVMYNFYRIYDRGWYRSDEFMMKNDLKVILGFLSYWVRGKMPKGVSLTETD